MSMADRILIMRDGVIQQLGTPHDVFNQPINEFVAGFVGEPPMNFLPARLFADASGFHLALPSGGSVPLPPHYYGAAGALEDTEFNLGIRPHNIRIGLPEPGEGGAAGTIYVIEPLGDNTIVTIKLANATVKVEAPADFSGQYDQPVKIAFSPEDALLFGRGGEQVMALAKS
jgi:multiple sugar transport system ATP-binding protein